MKFDEKWAEGGPRRALPPYADMNAQNTSGKIKLHGTAKPWLFNKFTELINDFMCLLVNWDLWQEGDILPFMKGKNLSFSLVSNGRVLIFFSCQVSSGVNRLGNSTWCLTKPPSPSCTWCEIREDLGIQELKKLVETIPTTVYWVRT